KSKEFVCFAFSRILFTCCEKKYAFVNIKRKISAVFNRNVMAIVINNHLPEPVLKIWDERYPPVSNKNINNNDCIFSWLFIDDFRHRNITTHAKLQKNITAKSILSPFV
ncbi:TPA: hypothetical protein ACH7CM_005851, partial [Escherichia coli]